MLFRLRCVALLGLLSLPCTTAQGSQNASSTQSTLSSQFNSSVPPSPSRTLNSTSPEDYVQSCNNVWQSYKRRMTRPYTTEVATITETLSVSTSLLGIQTCSSTCGSICYADNLTITSTVLIPGTYLETKLSSSTRLTYSEPAPNCTIPTPDCRQLWTSFTSADVAWSKTGGSGSPLTPGCTAGCQRTTCRFGGGDKGAVPTPGVQERYWNSLKLFYFPETRNVSRDMCATSPAQGPVPAVPLTTYIPTTTDGFVVQDGKTLYSGNVYISIDQLEVGDNCGYTTVMHDVAFPVASTDVQSKRANEGNKGYWSVDWADFNEPVPYSAFAGGQGMTFPALPPEEVGPGASEYCKTAICGLSSVIPGKYNPWIILPQAIKNLNPEFKDCEIPSGLTWFDPPIALHSVPNFLTTASPEPVSTPASPASSVSALPVQTTSPASGDPPTGDPPTNDPPTNSSPPNDPPGNTNSPGNNPLGNDPPTGEPGASSQLLGRPASSSLGQADPAASGDRTQLPVPGSPGGSNAGPANSNNPRPTGNGAGPGASPTNAPAQASRPQITIGPTVIPVAPDGQGLVIHSPTTFAPSGSAVIGGTTFHLSSGVLTIASSGRTSSMTLGDPSGNAVGSVVGLGSGGAFTITTAGGSLVFNVETTMENGDPAQTVGDMIISVGSGGVQMSNSSNGEQTSIAFSEIDGLFTKQDGSVEAAAFTGAASNLGASGASAYNDGGTAMDTLSRASATSGSAAADSTYTSAGGSGSLGTASGASASGTASGGSSQGSGNTTSETSGSASGPNEGAAASASIPWYLQLLSIAIVALQL